MEAAVVTTSFTRFEGIPIWGEHEEKPSSRSRCVKTADKAALMAGGHLGHAVPIGGVVAYKDRISPSGVDFDLERL